MVSLADQMKPLIRGAHEIRKMTRLKAREDLSRLFNSHLKLYFDFFAYKNELVAVRNHEDRFDAGCSKRDYVVNLVILLVKGIVRALLIESVGEAEQKADYLRKTIIEIVGSDPDFDSKSLSLAQLVQLFEKKAILSSGFRARFVEYLNHVINTKYRGQCKTVDRFLEVEWKESSLVQSALNLVKHVVLHQGIRANVYFATQHTKKAIFNHFEIFKILPDVIIILSIDDGLVWISHAIFDNGSDRDAEISTWDDSFSSSHSDNPAVKDPWLHLRVGRAKPFESASEKQPLAPKKPKLGITPALIFERTYKKPSDSSSSQPSIYPRSSGEAGSFRYDSPKAGSEAELQELNIYEDRCGNGQPSSRTESYSKHAASKSLSQSAPYNEENQQVQDGFERLARTQPLKDPFLQTRSSSRNTAPLAISGSSRPSLKAKAADPGTEYHQQVLARREARAESRPRMGEQQTGLQLKLASQPQPNLYDAPLPKQFDSRAIQQEYHSVSSGSQGFLDNIIGGMNRGTGESSDGEKPLTFRGSGSSNPFPTSQPNLTEQTDRPMHMLRELAKQQPKPLFMQAVNDAPHSINHQQAHASYTDRYLSNLEAKRLSAQQPHASDQRLRPHVSGEGRIFTDHEPQVQATPEGHSLRRMDGFVPQSSSSTKSNQLLLVKPSSINQPYFAEQRFTFANPAQTNLPPQVFARRDNTLQHSQNPPTRQVSPPRLFLQPTSNPSSKINIFGQSDASHPQPAQPQPHSYHSAQQLSFTPSPASPAGHLYQPSYQHQLKPLMEPNSALDFSLGSIVNAFDKNTDLIAERRKTNRGESVGRREAVAGMQFTPINLYAPSQPHQSQRSDRVYY